MNPLRSRKALIAIAAVVAVAGSSLGLYLHFRPQASARPASPTVVTVGAQTVTKAATAEYLSVVNTSPGAGSVGEPVNTSITFDFNLSVDPVAVQSYFSVLPNSQGSFAQGNTVSQVVFTPSTNFAAGSSVNVALRGGLTSRDGFALQNDYSLNFQTEVSAQGVMFQAANQVATLVNAQSGRPVSVTVQLGDQVPADIALQTYRSNVSDVLTALVHSSNGQYLNNAIVTTSMQLVDTKSPVMNGNTMTVAQPDGIYLLLATDAAGQYGAMWVDFSKYGVLVRQDDQKIVVAGEDLSTGDTTPFFKITFYNLQDSRKVVMSGGFSGSQEFPARYPSGIDVAVATSTDGEQLLVPISAPASDADLKVVGDLAMQPQIYLSTDRAGYQKGDTAKFAGVVRLSNDQAYTIPAGMKVAVWAGTSPSRLVDQTASVASDGTFSGSFPIPDGAFNQDGTDAQLTLYADVAGHPNDYSSFFTVVAALAPHTPAGKLSVSLDKTVYLASDTIVASISGTDSNAKPLANQPLSLSFFSTQYQVQPHEMDSFLSPSTWGVPVQQNVKVQLDATGHATYSLSANLAQKAADQQVTVGVTFGTGASAIVGARTAVVYQAADEVFLLASRSVYQPGDQVAAPFVVETRAGDRVANMPVAYEFDRTDYQGSNTITTVVASGSVSTDGNGLGIVRATYSGSAGAVVLRVKAKDAAGNGFVDAKALTITNDPTSLVSFGATDTLLELGLTADKIAYSAGDSAHLTVTTSSPQKVFLSLERGRIHQYKWVTLAQGDNPLDLAISPDLAPGFTLMFSYFRNGAYISEGLPISVSNSSQLLKVTVTADQAGYAAGQTAHLTVAVSDSAGAPVAATLLVDGYDASMSSYKLVDQRSIARVFQSPAPRGTNASSSLLGIGNWGGRCGAGGNPEQPATTNPGHLAVWLPDVTTDANGHATIDVPVAQTAVRVSFVAATSASAWGQVETDLSVQ